MSGYDDTSTGDSRSDYKVSSCPCFECGECLGASCDCGRESCECCCHGGLLNPNTWAVLAGGTIVLTFLISYPIAIKDGDLGGPGHDYHPAAVGYFLSSSIAYPPESMVGSFFLGVACMFCTVLFYLRYLFINAKMQNYRPADGDTSAFCCCKGFKCCCGWKCCNCTALFIGILAAFGAFGVGSVQYVNAETLHYICAYVAFFGFNVYIFFQTYALDPIVELADQEYGTLPGKCWRIAFSWIGPIAMAVMMSAGFSTDENVSTDAVTIAAIAEATLVFGFVLWCFGLVGSFMGYRFKVVTYRKSDADELAAFERNLRAAEGEDLSNRGNGEEQGQVYGTKVEPQQPRYEQPPAQEQPRYEQPPAQEPPRRPESNQYHSRHSRPPAGNTRPYSPVPTNAVPARQPPSGFDGYVDARQPPSGFDGYVDGAPQQAYGAAQQVHGNFQDQYRGFAA